MRLLFSIIVVILVFCGRGAAQEDNVTTSADALQQVLSNLKSVEKLSVDNDQLASRGNAVKQQILKLQVQLKQLQDQGEALNKASAQLYQKDPRFSQQITRLEKENFDLDDATQRSEALIALTQKSLEAGYKEDQQLLLQLKGMANTLPAPKPIPAAQPQAAVHQEKEKPLPAVHPWDINQLRELETELKQLETNYVQLKDLVEKMSKKDQADKLTVGEKVESQKLKSTIDDLNHQGAELRIELDDLRTQMVDLDKRKSRLQAMIQQLP